MAITDKTRKILWAKSGNRCAICKVELVMNSGLANNTIIGDECHIVSKQKGGPRYSQKSDLDHDEYGNLILLCKIHHTLIDDNSDEYSVDSLKKLKKNHEDWVDQILRNGVIRFESQLEDKEKIDDFLPRVISGQQLVKIVQGAHLFDFSNCEPRDPDEVDLVGSFGEILQDSGDLLDELGVGKRIEIEFQLEEMLNELESRGFLFLDHV